jgi:hypothetical protein
MIRCIDCDSTNVSSGCASRYAEITHRCLDCGKPARDFPDEEDALSLLEKMACAHEAIGLAVEGFKELAEHADASGEAARRLSDCCDTTRNLLVDLSSAISAQRAHEKEQDNG